MMQKTGMMYIGDDRTYFSYATALAFFEFPSFEKELHKNPKHFIGSGILATPFVFAFSLIDHMRGAEITIERRGGNVVQSWTLFGFVFSTIFYFWLSCFLLYRGLRYHFNEMYAVIAVVLMVLIQGVPLYVYRRPIFSHAYEFFLQSLLVFIAVRNNSRDANEKNESVQCIIIGILIGLMSLVRYNNVIIALTWPVVVWGVWKNKLVIVQNWKKLALTYVVFVLPIVVFLIFPEIYTGKGASSYIIERLWNYIYGIWAYDWTFMYVKPNLRVLFGVDWGLFYTAPFMVFSAIALCYFKTAFKKTLLIPFVPVVISYAVLVVGHSHHASWYGYRYIIFSAIPVLILPMAQLVQPLHDRFGKKIYLFFGFIALFPLLSMLCFEGNPGNLTLHVSEKWSGWKNPTYQLEVWKTALFHPMEFSIAVLKGGPLYLIYLFTVIFDKTSILPEIVFQKYPVFDIQVLIKSVIIYLSPIGFYFIHRRFFNPSLSYFG